MYWLGLRKFQLLYGELSVYVKARFMGNCAYFKNA